MRNGTYKPKRRSEYDSSNTRNTFTNTSYGSFGARNRNMVKPSSNFHLGSVSTILVMIILVAFAGITYVGQSTRSTSYDYEISSLQAEIDDLESKKDDLAVEKARLSSINNSNNSQVAASMENATTTAYTE